MGTVCCTVLSLENSCSSLCYPAVLDLTLHLHPYISVCTFRHATRFLSLLQYGLRRTEFSLWVTLAQAAAYHVAMLPLAAQNAAAFNETAYWQWFYTVQGMPYGYHTMLMS